MTPEDRRRSALELVQLRRLFGQGNAAADMPKPLRELGERHLQRLRALMAEVYAEQFSDEQLQALLEFYGSERGKGITETESVIAERFKDKVKAVAAELNEEAARVSRGVINASVGVKQPSDRDN